MRRHWLDNVRWATVLLVLVYHAGFLFNGVGIPGRVGGGASSPAWDALCAFLYPWFMILLFAVAGMSARYALDRRSAGAWLRSRVTKLLVPATLGLFAYQWVGGWLNIRIGGGLSSIPAPLVYPIAAVSGIGPLWFAQMLFLFSAALALTRTMGGRTRFRFGAWSACGRLMAGSAALPVLLACTVPVWIGAQVGNLPVLTMYRFGVYGVAFAIGYLLLSHDGAIAALVRAAVPLCVSAVALGMAFVTVNAGRDWTADAVLRHPLTNLYAWVATLAALAAAARWADRATPATCWLSQAGFGLFVVHYPVMLWICHGLSMTAIPSILLPVCGLALGAAVSVGVWGLLRRIPVVRWLVLGVRA